MILSDIDEKLLVICTSRPHIIISNSYLWVNNPVHCARAHFSIYARNRLVKVVEVGKINPSLGNAILWILVQKAVAGCKRQRNNGEKSEIFSQFHCLKVLRMLLEFELNTKCIGCRKWINLCVPALWIRKFWCESISREYGKWTVCCQTEAYTRQCIAAEFDVFE